jgi:hypothetical protein
VPLVTAVISSTSEGRTEIVGILDEMESGIRNYEVEIGQEGLTKYVVRTAKLKDGLQVARTGDCLGVSFE